MRVNAKSAGFETHAPHTAHPSSRNIVMKQLSVPVHMRLPPPFRISPALDRTEGAGAPTCTNPLHVAIFCLEFRLFTLPIALARKRDKDMSDNQDGQEESASTQNAPAQPPAAASKSEVPRVPHSKAINSKFMELFQRGMEMYVVDTWAYYIFTEEKALRVLYYDEEIESIVVTPLKGDTPGKGAVFISVHGNRNLLKFCC